MGGRKEGRQQGSPSKWGWVMKLHKGTGTYSQALSARPYEETIGAGELGSPGSVDIPRCHFGTGGSPLLLVQVACTQELSPFL